MKKMRFISILTLHSLVCAESPAAIAPRLESRQPIGILRLGELRSHSEERAYDIVERRLQRWLDNFESLHVRAQRVGVSLSAEEVTLDSDRARLMECSEELLKGVLFMSEHDLNPGLTEMKTLRDGLKRVKHLGPVLQKAYIAEASYLWKRKKREHAKSLIQKALLLHPDAKIESLPQWEWDEPGFDTSGFEAMVRDSGALRKGCRVQVQVSPSNALVRVNGFEMGRRKTFYLSQGSSYLLSAAMPGYETNESVLECDGRGQRRLLVPLKKEDRKINSKKDSLFQVSSRYGVESLCLVEPKRGEFRLHLYSPGLAMEEIPMLRPLLVAEVLDSPGDEALPIATDAFLQIFQKHRLARLTAVLDPLPSTLKYEASGTSDTWYNNWKVWAIVGGVIGGAALAYFATSNSVDSRPGGIKIKID